jgi:2-methylcitrate dehydratase PrpD
MNGIQELADLLQAQSGNADAALAAKLRLHVADTVGAWIAATQTPEGQALLAFRGRMRANTKTAASNLHDDLAVHCALVRLSEIDDIHLPSMTTPGSIVIPAALTLASALPGAQSADAAAAMLAGYQAMIRLGLAIKGPDVLYRGIWPTYFGAPFATAAVAARLMRLTPAQTAHALALALTMSAPSVGQHHATTTARWFSVGNAARNGLTAALAAQSGFTADLDILKSRLFPDVYGIEPDIAKIAGDAVPTFADVSFKPWCAARQTMPATQALRELAAAGIRADEITAITAFVLPPHLKMIDHGVRPGDRASFLTSLPYQLALAALQPTKAVDLTLSAAVPLSALQEFMTRVKVAADETLLAAYPARWPARILVETASGRRELRVDSVPGDPARPFTQADVENKFRHFAAPVAGADTDRILQSSLAALDDRETLLALMHDLAGIMTRALG